ncbi:MAG TPA: protein kinase [Vicinamibacteria bacterium]|nr:protein kinase [Vicinamibacteria bacterium]
MAHARGTLLGSYEILALLGSGGMGDVYRARDRNLGREVAIKVLRPDVASDATRLKRFEQEARTASALNHPNIVTIYEIGEHDGEHYIAMEHVDGDTLRELLASGPLPPRKLLDLGRQIAEGLAKAHAAGIVHRDLKPENLMLSRDGYVKILDFGLAKLWPDPSGIDTEMATSDRLETEEGVIVGTVAYMSPEQAKGRAVDFRSDQFSFGAILYELATGKRPFERSSIAETLLAILREEPSPVASENPSVPPHLARILERCLAKDPQDRYDSTRDLAREILASESSGAAAAARTPWRAGALAAAVLAILVVGIFVSRNHQGGDRNEEAAIEPGIQSIAVLPLENLSGDPEQEYFADGMTEALITELSRFSALRVVSRTSVMRYKDTSLPLPEIARELDVDAVVEGSVLKAEGRVRVTAQLVDARADRYLWAENYDRDLQDILALHSDVARQIARKVEVALTPAEESRLAEAEARPIDPEAYEAYLRGRYYFNRTSEVELEKAVDYFERALAREPAYAAAYSGLADSYNRLGMTLIGRPPGEMRAKAIAAASEALRIDGGLAEAHVSLGWAKFFDRDWPGAEESFERAMALNPKYAEAHQLYSLYLVALGRFDEAIAEGRSAVELDPLSLNSQARLGQVLFYARHYDDAIRVLRNALELDPNFVFALWHLGDTYTQVSRYDEAISVLEKAVTLSKRNPAVVGYLGCAYAKSGRHREARELRKELTELSETRYMPPITWAWFHACLKDRESAFESLEKAFAERSYILLYLGVYPPIDWLRDDPRYKDLIRRISFPSDARLPS